MEDKQMPYSADELANLRSRWKKPLWDPDQEKHVAVEGCKTYEELLRLRLNGIAKVVESWSKDRPEKDSVAGRDAVRKLWDLFANDAFFRTLLMLKQYGLDDYLPLNKMDEFLRRPCAIDMRGAECVGAHFEGANCREAHFEGANCREAHFDGAMCWDAHFEGAEYGWARFDRANCTRAHFEKANCTRAHFEGSYCGGANFEGVNFLMAHFEKANCELANFKGVNCGGGNFEGTNCGGANFEGATCTGTNFSGADCKEARFSGADCREANFDGANCQLAVFRLAKAPGASFQGTLLKSAEIREMDVFSDTKFGIPGEQISAQIAGNDVERWLDAADSNLRVKHCLKSSGYYQRADEYQFNEMKCRGRARQGIWKHLDYIFYYLIAGYGIRPIHPLTSIGSVIVGFGIFFTLFFLSAGTSIIQATGKGFYYSITSFTTLGLGGMQPISGTPINFLLCVEALLGVALMPLFIVTYARRVLQA
jgi:uncharacterized protein YjbI with pentapeptide repeats